MNNDLTADRILPNWSLKNYAYDIQMVKATVKKWNKAEKRGIHVLDLDFSKISHTLLMRE